MTRDNDLALEFLRKAEHDLGSARLLLTGENLFDSVCFHCQQLAEKSIKAALTRRSIRFKKVHDLDVLLSLLDDPDFNPIRSYALILNSYAVDARIQVTMLSLVKRKQKKHYEWLLKYMDLQ